MLDAATDMLVICLVLVIIIVKCRLPYTVNKHNSSKATACNSIETEKYTCCLRICNMIEQYRERAM